MLLAVSELDWIHPNFLKRPGKGDTLGKYLKLPRLISEVKHRRAWVVLGWVTTWEVRVIVHLILPQAKSPYLLTPFGSAAVPSTFYMEWIDSSATTLVRKGHRNILHDIIGQALPPSWENF